MKAHEDDDILVGSRANSDPVAALGDALDALPQTASISLNSGGSERYMSFIAR